jgi:glyoxylate reductase
LKGEVVAQQRPRILVTRRLPETIESRMATLFEARFSAADEQLGAEAILAALENCDVLVSSITDRLDAELLARFPPSVRLIAQFGNGFDNIDIEAAYRAGITVTNTPSVLTEDTADMAVMLMLALPRRLVEGAQVLPTTGTWPGWSPTWMLGRRLRGKTLGIVGMGRIGAAVASRAHALGLNIQYFSRHRRPPLVEEPLGAVYRQRLDEMLSEVDIVSLHTPLTRDTLRILDAAQLARLKPEAFVVNVARSELIDEAALIERIEGGLLAGAALDVFDSRNGAVNPRLLALARAHKVLLTAHMASATLEARIEMGETVIVNIRAFVDGHQPPHRVLPDGLTSGAGRG